MRSISGGGLLLMGLTITFMSVDWAMSLDPRWYSGLFGGYYVVTSMYTGFGLVTYLTIRSNERGLSRVGASAIQDVAKLTFALSVFWKRSPPIACAIANRQGIAAYCNAFPIK